MAVLNLRARPEQAPARALPVLIYVSGAKDVVITGDFTGWALDKVRMDKGPGDEWHTTLMLPPGTYQYRLRIDGAWFDNPLATERVPNPYGGDNCLLSVS